ncbi:MAG TPA: ATP-binding protein [Kofleriaceae bacterium]|nr:ATP-binding protein [Kofleriaceae bacterium]
MLEAPDVDGGVAAEVARAELVLAHRSGPLEVPKCPERSLLARAATLFGLDSFERWALTLAIGAEIEPRLALQLTRRDDNFGAAWPSAGLAMSTMRGGRASHTAFEPDAALRAWGLIELDGPGPLPARAIRLAPGVAAWVRPVRIAQDAALVPLEQLDLPAAVRARCDRAADGVRGGTPTIVVVSGEPGTGRTTVAAAIAACAGGAELVRRTSDHPEATRFSLRDACWYGQVAVIEVDDQAALPHMADVVSRLRRPLIIVGTSTTAARLAELGAPTVVDVPLGRPDARASARLWSAVLPPEVRGPDLDLAVLASRFRLGPAQIAAAARLARSQAADQSVSRAAVEAAGRAVSTSKLGELAQPLPADRTLDDLVLPSGARRELALAIAWARHGTTVFADDGAGSALARGPGMACLFYGPSGTGKTLGARVLANAIGLALYRVDLSQIMDKYIGETEKRLDRLFNEAERGNAILFFDEADVLFAKRTDINEARDRYANLETGYLLQRIERHPAVCILATNLRDNFDPAFLRRIPVIVEFPAPRPAERAAIWRRLLPAERADDIDVDWLGQRFALTGGEINNAIAAALLVAAAEQRTLAMRDVVFGVWRELRKSGRLLEAGHFGPWANHVVELVKEARVGMS